MRLPERPSGTFGGTRSSAPAFTGLLVHRDPVHKYSLLIPEGWHRLPLEGEAGALFAPDPADLHTSLSVSARDLGLAVAPSDLPTLRSGFVAGLRRVPGSRLERIEAEAVGQLITMEARQTFREGDAPRTRWIRLAYQGSTQVRLVAQGSSPERFAHWEPMFFQAMRTLRFGDWSAEVTGSSWAAYPFSDEPS
ncbi:MAG TPA: hypothetical protein VG370_12355 [Chloroflexota bacterium]|nr:hypothetical protein [Chloroflexota bacterium]